MAVCTGEEGDWEEEEEEEEEEEGGGMPMELRMSLLALGVSNRSCCMDCWLLSIICDMYVVNILCCYVIGDTYLSGM